MHRVAFKVGGKMNFLVVEELYKSYEPRIMYVSSVSPRAIVILSC